MKAADRAARDELFAQMDRWLAMLAELKREPETEAERDCIFLRRLLEEAEADRRRCS